MVGLTAEVATEPGWLKLTVVGWVACFDQRGGFCDQASRSCEVRPMATPAAEMTSSQAQAQAQLEEERRQAEEDFARGDYVGVAKIRLR